MSGRSSSTNRLNPSISPENSPDTIVITDSTISSTAHRIWYSERLRFSLLTSSAPVRAPKMFWTASPACSAPNAKSFDISPIHRARLAPSFEKNRSMLSSVISMTLPPRGINPPMTDPINPNSDCATTVRPFSADFAIGCSCAKISFALLVIASKSTCSMPFWMLVHTPSSPKLSDRRLTKSSAALPISLNCCLIASILLVSRFLRKSYSYRSISSAPPPSPSAPAPLSGLLRTFSSSNPISCFLISLAESAAPSSASSPSSISSANPPVCSPDTSATKSSILNPKNRATAFAAFVSHSTATWIYGINCVTSTLMMLPSARLSCVNCADKILSEFAGVISVLAISPWILMDFSMM